MHPVNPIQLLCPGGKGPGKNEGDAPRGGVTLMEMLLRSIIETPAWEAGFCSAKPSASWVCAVPPFAVSSHCFTESGVQATNTRSTANSIRNLKNRIYPIQEARVAEPQSCPTTTFWFSGKKASPTIYRTPSLLHFLRLPFLRLGSCTNT